MISGYALVCVLAAAGALKLWGWRASVIVLLMGMWLYFGVEKVPWPALMLIVTVIAVQVGGLRVGALAAFGLLFIAIAGIWPFAMKSIYLCGAAVLTSFVVGGLVGVWAAHSDRLSAFVRPINDTLQTMPLFVLLIPVLMFFQIGEFTAYLAIIMYAVVPAIRYTEHGLRRVPPEIIEAATSMGCTRNQLLWAGEAPARDPRDHARAQPDHHVRARDARDRRSRRHPGTGPADLRCASTPGIPARASWPGSASR